MGEGKKHKRIDDDAPVYTFVNCGVPRRGLSIWGYRSRDEAIARAIRHYEMEMERVQAALDALHNNRASVVWTRSGSAVPRDQAIRAHNAINNNRDHVPATASA